MKDFDIETFNALVKDIRNAHRTISDPKNDTTFLEQRKGELTDAIQKASMAADIDAIREHTAELNRVLTKLKAGPQEALDKFSEAHNKLERLLAGEEIKLENAA